MKPVLIFVEGPADRKFIKDYIDHIASDIEFEEDNIIETNGCDNNRELATQKMRRNMDEGGLNLVIYDADNDIDKKRKQIETWKDKDQLSFDLFLFPNNRETGALEDLLEKIIAPANKPIFECWNGYEMCLRSKHIEGRTEPLTIPAKKTKIYGYLEALHGTNKKEKEKIKEKNRDYNNPSFWNLDSEDLEPLKEFLIENLKKE